MGGRGATAGGRPLPREELSRGECRRPPPAAESLRRGVRVRRVSDYGGSVVVIYIATD